MLLIWLQSSYFNPEELASISSQINVPFILIIGILLELLHFIQFGILYALFIIFFLTFQELKPKHELVAAVLAILYSVIDEIHQFYIPYRSMSGIDLLKNVVGVGLLWMIIHKSYFKRSRSKIGHFLKNITIVLKSS
ncbi:VanZ family protein [Metabacillus arenae]|nr:VanZ family protein [Metabacillus arenae]